MRSGEVAADVLVSHSKVVIGYRLEHPGSTACSYRVSIPSRAFTLFHSTAPSGTPFLQFRDPPDLLPPLSLVIPIRPSCTLVYVCKLRA
jgi:hypothetical protein